MKLKEFFYMPRTDRRSFMCLAVLLLVVAVGMMILSCPSGSNDVAKTDKHDSIANAEQGAVSSFIPNADRRTDDNITERKVETFFFDPNTADSLTFFRLGLQRWQVRNILRYRARGGVFQRKEDFGRVYGLTAGQYHRLAPYIRIAPEFRPAAELEEVQRRYYADGRQYRRYASEGDAHGRSESTGSSSHGGAGSAEAAAYDESRYGHKLSKGEHISINVSDTTALKRVPGIGSYYARQVVRLRERLGGIASTSQLLEIENFPKEALQYIHIDGSNVHRLNVNRLTLQQLKRHPYINYYQARAITDYRRLHGEISSIDQLGRMKEFKPADLQRLAPYLEF